MTQPGVGHGRPGRARMRRSGPTRSPTSLVATIVVLLVVGVGASAMAWRTALPLEGRLYRDGLPLEFIHLALSLGFLFAAVVTGFWILGQVGMSERAMLAGCAASIAVVTAYGTASTAVFVLATASAWALTAIVPAACIAYVLGTAGTLWRERRDRSADGPGGGA